MRNGIKKLFLTSLFMIFGMCFNSSFAYTQIDDCYVDRTNGSNHGTCRDYNVNESFNTNGATVSYGAYLNTPGNSKTFLYTIEGEYNSKSYRSEYYLLYREDGYVSIFQGIQNLTENKSSLYVYTGNGKYCIPTDNINVCGSASSNANTAYTKTIAEVNSGIDGATMTGYKILYQTTATSNLPYTTTTNAICPMYDNGFIFCMPLRSDSGPNTLVGNMGRYGLGTRTNIFDSQNLTNIYDYINTNYTISETPLTVVEPQTTPTPVTWSCPTIQDLINAYPTNYNTGLCYSSSLIVSNGTLQTVTPSSIFELFPSIQEFGNYINLYNNYCTSANTTTACQTAFDGNQDKYTLIAKLPNETNRIGIYQYCHYQLNIENKNTSTCVMSTGEMYATGVDQEIAEQIENQNTSLIGLIEDSIQNIKEIPTFNTGYVFDELLDDGETRTDGIKLDVFKTFLLLWSKITTIFYFRNSQPGIIPEFITTIIIIIVLFKLFKK